MAACKQFLKSDDMVFVKVTGKSLEGVLGQPGLETHGDGIRGGPSLVPPPDPSTFGAHPPLPSCPNSRLSLPTWHLAERWLRGEEESPQLPGRRALQGLEPTRLQELATEDLGLDFPSLTEDTQGIS